MNLLHSLSDIFAPVVDFIYPPRCPLCGAGLAAQGGLCAGCWAELVIPGEPSCAKCQRPFGGGSVHEGAICAPCLADPPRHDGIAAATLYNEASRSLVLAYKHGGRIGHARLLARLIAARLGPLAGDWLLVPVPLHRWRLWQRGFNQSALLAREIGHMLGKPVLPDGLLRIRRTPALGGMGRKARRRALAGAIRVHPAHAAGLKGRRLILVDDVLTSGATADACIAALRRAGAVEIRIACFARVLDEALDITPKTKAPGENPGARVTKRNSGLQDPL